MPNKKRIFWVLVKIAISFSLVAYILRTQTSFREIGESLSGVRFGWLAVAVSLHSLGLLISAYRWQILARAQGDEVPLLYLVKSYLVGSFFNNFLPTRFGGDVVRIWDGSKYSESLVKSSAIVIVERMTGLVVLFLFALGASLIRLDVAQRIPVIWASLLVGLLGLLLIAVFFLPPTAVLLQKLPARGVLHQIRQKVITFRETILFYRTKKKPFFQAILWAFLLQVNVVIYYFLVGKALHLKIPLIDYFIFIPIVVLIQTIPITLGGLGLREGAYIEIFKFYNVPAQAAVSFSLLGDVAVGILIGLLGGIIYISRKS